MSSATSSCRASLETDAGKLLVLHTGFDLGLSHMATSAIKFPWENNVALRQTALLLENVAIPYGSQINAVGGVAALDIS